MSKGNVIEPAGLPVRHRLSACGAPAQVGTQTGDALSELLRGGARQLIHQAVEVELQELLGEHVQRPVCVRTRTGRRLADGRAGVVRNGYLPERELQDGLGSGNGQDSQSAGADGRGGDAYAVSITWGRANRNQIQRWSQGNRHRSGRRLI